MIKIKDTEFVLGEPGRAFIIAEAGYNHEGSFKEAKELIHQAKQSQADAVKFQIVKADEFVSKDIQKSQDEAASMKEEDNLYWELKRAELTEEEYRELLAYAKEQKILLFASFTEKETADFLKELNIPLLKLASGELTNLPFLKYAAQKELPMILSTGMATMEEVETAVKTILSTGNDQLALLHAVSCYPVQTQDANVSALRALKNRFPELPIGYSDHTLGILASVLAVSLGATIIEKHFTLDKNRPGADHSTSMEPDEFLAMVQAIREIETLVGEGEKEPRKAEQEMRKLARRSLVAKVPIAKGELFSYESVDTMRPALGLEPAVLDEIIGKRAKCDLKVGEVLTSEKVAR